MKIGVLSDAHGNFEGFNTCLKLLKKSDHFIFAGDLFGYYFDSLKILKQLKSLKATCILGNHDLYFLSYLGLDYNVNNFSIENYLKRYGNSFKLAKKKISDDDLSWLRSLTSEVSINLDNKNFLIVHGSPWNSVNEYIYPNNNNLDKFNSIKEDIVIMGHTHYPLFKKLIGGKVLFNPGSCGQPRDKDRRASCGMIHIKNDNVLYNTYRQDYSFNKVLNQCEKWSPNCNLLTKYFKEENE